MKRILILTIFLIFLCSPAGAITYYIDADAADDTGTGLVGDPWKTITKLNTELVAGTFNYGDEILFDATDTWTITTHINLQGSQISIGGIGSVSNRLRFGVDGAGAAPIIQYASGSSSKMAHISVNHIEIDGLVFKRGHLYCYDMDYSIIENCTIEGGYRGIWFHEYCNNNEIRYNTIDAKESTYSYESYEGVQLGKYTTPPNHRNAGSTATINNIIHNNVFKNWTHISIGMYGGCDYNSIYNNYFYDAEDANGAGGSIGFGYGRYNKFYNNWCETSEYFRIDGQYNEVFGNIFTMVSPGAYAEYVHSILLIDPNANSTEDNCYNKIYNNIFYNGWEEFYEQYMPYSAVFVIINKTDYAGSIHHNEFTNNIVLEWDLNVGNTLDYAIYMGDQNGGASTDIVNNIFKNNSIYKTSGATGNIIRWGTNTYTVAQWNTGNYGGTVDGNLTSDPGLADPANGLFYQNAAGDAVVDAGSADTYSTYGLQCRSGTEIVEADFKDLDSATILLELRDATPDIGPYEWESGATPPTGCNDISVDPNCVFWYEFSNNGNDSNTQIATYNLSDGNSPAYEGAACAAGVDTGFVTLVDADNDYMYSAAFDQLTGDFTAYFCFTLTNNLGDGEEIYFGQWEGVDDERTWLLHLGDPAGGLDENWIWGGVGHNDGVGADGDSYAGIYSESGGSNFPVLIDVSYRFVIRYDNSEDDFFVHLYTASNGTEVATNSNLALLGANTQYTGSAVELGIGCFFAGGVATVRTGDIEIHESALFNEFLTEAECDKLGDGTFIGVTAAVSTITTTADLTSAGFHSIYVNFNRDVSAPSPGSPTIQVSYDYPTDPVTYTFHTMTDSDTAQFRAYAAAGYRQGAFGDAQIADAIVLPDGITWTDPQDVNISLDISGLGTYPAHKVAIAGTVEFGVSDVTDFANVEQIANDIWQVKDDTLTGPLDITVNGLMITGIGRKRTVTDALTQTADNIIVRCVMFASGCTDNGSGNSYHPVCTKGSSHMGMGLR